MNPLVQRKWNPYVVGIGIGVLSWVTFLTMDKALGTSTSFVHVAGMVESLFAPAHVSGPEASAYFAKEINAKTPLFDWQLFLVMGVFLGALLSSVLSGDRPAEKNPALWAWRFGPSVGLRYAAAFGFGAVMLYGARLAGGCTSGHAISGGLQLALSSWVFTGAMFASGIAAAFALFGAEGGAMSLVDSWPLALGGLLAGLVFGFLLQKGQVAKYGVIVGQFLLVDYTVAKVMLTAIVVGAVGVYGMLSLGLIDGLLVKPALLVGDLVGGAVFGVGMVGLGYCPGTGVAAVAAGSRHALFGVLGMVVGAAVFTETYPWVERTFLKTADYGKVTLGDVTGWSPWVFIGLLALCGLVLFRLVDRRKAAIGGGT